MIIAAATTQRAIGWVIFITVILGFIVYIIANLRSAKPEVSSEIELAANRKPYLSDEELESKKLDRSLAFALGMLVIIGVGLPLYWLGEPGRHAGADAMFDMRSVSRGEASYQERCESCHGPGGVGGVAVVTLTDADNRFVAQVSWKAPALTSIMSRFDAEEIAHVLIYGRNGVMPAWGEAGGGPLNEQQIDDLIFYMRDIQMPEAQLRADVEAGLRAGARELVIAAGAAEDEIEAEIDALLAEVSNPNSPRFASVYGRLLFNNPAAQGSYNCARCHTAGWAYDGADVVSRQTGQPLIDAYVDGNGFFGPNLRDGTTIRKFDTADQHFEFIEAGSSFGRLFGNAGWGSGQMPGFGPRLDEDTDTTYPGTLTDDQIAAIVAYERSL